VPWRQRGPDRRLPASGRWERFRRTRTSASGSRRPRSSSRCTSR